VLEVHAVTHRKEALKDAPVPAQFLLSACWREEAHVADLAQVEHVTDALQAADISIWGAVGDGGLGCAGE
jgi:hypothetical protein